MDEPLTEELLNELLDAPSPQLFLSKHPSKPRKLSNYLQELLSQRGLQRKDVVRAAHLNDTYGYQIFTGERAHPGRDKVLQVAIAMQLSLLETDRALQAAGASRLYCKDRRDAIIIFCLDHHMSLDSTNDTLYSFGETTLG